VDVLICAGDGSDDPAFIVGIVSGIILALVIITVITIIIVVLKKRKSMSKFFRDSYVMSSPEPTAR